MGDGIGGQLQHGLGDALGVQHGFALGDLHQLPPAVAELLRLGLDVQEQFGGVDGPGFDEVGPLGLGDGEQVGDDPAHPVQLGVDEPHGLGAGGRVLGGVHGLQVPADDGDGGAQFVPGVVDEPALRVVGGLDAVEHRVEGHGELRDVVATVHGHAPGEVAFLDALGDLPHLADGGEDLPRHEVAEQGGQGEPGE